jgi:hypothetical protein
MTEVRTKEVVMRRIALVLAILGSVVACSSGTETVAVTGSTGMCATLEAEFSGERLAGANLPGRFLEAVVECPNSELSDDRLSGVATSEFRCEYVDRSGEIVADCVSKSVVANDGGTWRDNDGRFTITDTGIGIQGVVLQEGVRVGTGDYAGLQFRYRIEGVEHAYPWEITGTIEPAD